MTVRARALDDPVKTCCGDSSGGPGMEWSEGQIIFLNKRIYVVTLEPHIVG